VVSLKVKLYLLFPIGFTVVKTTDIPCFFFNLSLF